MNLWRLEAVAAVYPGKQVSIDSLLTSKFYQFHSYFPFQEKKYTEYILKHKMGTVRLKLMFRTNVFLAMQYIETFKRIEQSTFFKVSGCGIKQCLILHPK